MELVSNHNHVDSDEAFLNGQILRNSLKNKVVEGVTERPMKTLHKELCKAISTP